MDSGSIKYCLNWLILNQRILCDMYCYTGPDDMLEYPLGHDEDELSDSPEDEEDEDYMGEDAQKVIMPKEK